MNGLERETSFVREAVREAGELALRGFGGEVSYDEKPDGEGPVSAYDLACDRLLRERISREFPDDALLTEETADDGAWRTARRVWMVDPIDGTQEFVAGVPQYAIMVGLCVDGRPAVGAVYMPSLDRLVWGGLHGGAFVEQSGRRSQLHLDAGGVPTTWRVAVSRSHPSRRTDRVLAALAQVERLPMGSVGVKMAAVATGEADLYVATTSRIKLWDTCGPEAVVEAAGGCVRDLFGARLDYRHSITHRHGVLACSAARLDAVVAVTRPLASSFYGAQT